MNRRFSAFSRGGALVLLATFFLSLSASAAPQRSGPPEVLTNQSVISMAVAKLSKDLIATKISSTRNSFDVTANGIVNLHQSKVHQDLIVAMITVAADSKLGQPASRTPEVIDNQSIVSMMIAKVPKAVVLAKIQNTKSAFDTSSGGLVALQQARVPSDVIRVMVTKGGA